MEHDQISDPTRIPVSSAEFLPTMACRMDEQAAITCQRWKIQVCEGQRRTRLWLGRSTARRTRRVGASRTAARVGSRRPDRAPHEDVWSTRVPSSCRVLHASC